MYPLLHGQKEWIQDFLKAGDGGVEIFYHYEIYRKLVHSKIGVLGSDAKGFQGV
jgi:hypothetical protein